MIQEQLIELRESIAEGGECLFVSVVKGWF